MAENKASEPRTARAQIFDCESLPVPPGTKSRARLPRGLEEYEPGTSGRWWLMIAGAVVIALGAGVAIGRFLLP